MEVLGKKLSWRLFTASPELKERRFTAVFSRAADGPTRAANFGQRRGSRQPEWPFLSQNGAGFDCFECPRHVVLSSRLPPKSRCDRTLVPPPEAASCTGLAEACYPMAAEARLRLALVNLDLKKASRNLNRPASSSSCSSWPSCSSSKPKSAAQALHDLQATTDALF